MTTQQRQLVIVVASGLLLLTFLGLIVWFLLSATITITTNSADNTISLRKKSPTGQEKIDVVQNDKRVDARVMAGTYVVTVQNGEQSSSQIVELSAGGHKEISINLSETAPRTDTAEPVSSLGAGNIVAAHDTLRFFDRNAAEHRLYSVDGQNTVTLLDPATTYQHITWADPTFGIGYGTDKNNNYVFTKIEGNFASPIKTPFTVNDSSSFGVAPNHSWYISDTHTVYRGNADGSFTKVYTSKDGVWVSAVANDAILLSQRSAKSTREGDLVILHNNGDKYQIEGEAYEASWSPSGKKLVTSGDTSELFDDKFNKIGVLPNGNFRSPVWMDDNTLLYGVANSVMQYDLKTGKSTTFIAHDTVTGSPSQIAISTEKDYVYIAISKGGNRTKNEFRLERVPLHDQNVTDVPVQKLNLLIPNTVNGCGLNYMNFTQFAILTSPTSSKTNCVPAVTKYLNTYGVPTTNISYQQLPS